MFAQVANYRVLLSLVLALVLPSILFACGRDASVEDSAETGQVDSAVATATQEPTPSPTSADSATQQATETMAPEPTSAETDREALTALFNATDGANWISSTNWLSDKPLEEWQGVSVDDEGRVSRLRLELFGLSGPLPAELGKLANLEALQLDNNRLSGKIPAELSNLTNLEILGLDRNELSGEIPPELGKLANLTYLGLGANQITGEIPSELGKLLSLEVLGLGGNQLTGEIPPELGELQNLSYLKLSGNQLSGKIPPELGRLVNLEALHLNNTQLSGCIPDPLQNQVDAGSSSVGHLSFCIARAPSDTPTATAVPAVAVTAEPTAVAIAVVAVVVTPEPTPTPTAVAVTPVPTPTVGVAVAEPVTPVPTETATPSTIVDWMFISDGTLNGFSLRTNSVVTVALGDDIVGNVGLAVINNHEGDTELTVEAIATWWDHETGHWPVDVSVPALSVVEANVPLSLVPPAEPGSYALIFAAQPSKPGGYVASATHWEFGFPVWNNGDDVAGWSEVPDRPGHQQRVCPSPTAWRGRPGGPVCGGSGEDYCGGS